MTTKHLFFARGRGDRAEFCRVARSLVVPRLEALGTAGLSVALTEEANPRFSWLPLRRANLLMVSLVGEVDAGAVREALAPLGGEVFGYRVEESVPLRSERTWAFGEVSPGVVLLTLLVRNARLDDAAFMHEWHGVHTPKAMRIHPLWGYVRNVVREAVTEGAPAFDGVVEEHYRARADVMNPARMFGGLRFLPNMLEVARHVRHFLDLGRTENYLMTERRLREPR